MKHYILITLAMLAITAPAYAAPTVLPGAYDAWTHMDFGGTPTQAPPLNTSVQLRRVLTSADANPGTKEAFSVYMEMLDPLPNVLPWASWFQLDTNHTSGLGALTLGAKLINHGNWATALHGEALHDGTGPTIGLNLEISKMVSTGLAYGVVLLAKDGYSTPSGQWGDFALSIQSETAIGWKTGVRFRNDYVRAVHFDSSSTGEFAIDIQGNFTTGIHMRGNRLVMDAGTWICLESTCAIKQRYTSGRIEWWNGSRRLGYLVTDSSASDGRLN